MVKGNATPFGGFLVEVAASAAGFRLLSAAGVALRLRFALRFSPPSAPLFRLVESRPKTYEVYFFFKALTFAHRALAAAEILALPAALILRLFFGAAVTAGFAGEPKIRPSSFSSD